MAGGMPGGAGMQGNRPGQGNFQMPPWLGQMQGQMGAGMNQPGQGNFQLPRQLTHGGMQANEPLGGYQQGNLGTPEGRYGNVMQQGAAVTPMPQAPVNFQQPPVNFQQPPVDFQQPPVNFQQPPMPQAPTAPAPSNNFYGAPPPTLQPWHAGEPASQMPQRPDPVATQEYLKSIGRLSDMGLRPRLPQVQGNPTAMQLMRPQR